jgi:hypothetical protein
MAQFTKYTGTITGEVGSLITALDAILVTGQGWTKSFSGTNKAVYRAPSGNQLYLRVDDNGPGAGGAKEARITGYETMSDVDTGTGPFPTAAQGVGGVAMVAVRKSVSADSTARSYKAWADSRTIMFFCSTGDQATEYRTFMFGEIYSFVNSDSYRTAICGRAAENSGTLNNERLGTYQATIGTAGSGFFVARGHTGLSTSVLMGRHTDQAKSTVDGFIGGVPYPNPADGGLVLGRIWLHDLVTSPIQGIRGRIRGLWVPFHAAASYNDGDTFSGTGELAGKTFELVKTFGSAGGVSGVAVIETSNTLETN